jgi:glycosyltransferase involved in cell wall biosynthesis
VRILLVSQMYPGPDDPDLGVFVAQMERALEERGNRIDRAVIDRRAGGKLRYFELARAARRAKRPDVVYAHFLVPAGLIAALAQRAPLVVTAHGRDVRNVGAIPGVAAATRFTVRRASTVIAVSDYLRRELEAKVPEARGKTEVVDSGVDLERFPVLPAPERLPSFVCVGSLTERKNVVRLARAFERLAEGELTFVGDGPLRPELEGRRDVHVVGRVAHDEIPAHLARASVVCQPSLLEPLGQSLLEGMATGRSVVATRIGGPPEFVPPDAGVLVDPLDEESILDGLRRAAALPTPNPAAREAAEAHDLNVQASLVEAILERAARGRPA